jgi:hypothetical protein
VVAKPGVSQDHKALKVSDIQHGLFCVVTNNKVSHYIVGNHGYTAAISKVKLPWFRHGEGGELVLVH